MIAADLPVQRPHHARLLVADRHGRLRHWPRSALVELLQAGDLVIANDAATLPASLSGQHLATGRRVEVRLAGRRALALDQVHVFTAVLFGLGDFRMRTEERPAPPPVRPGERLVLGPLRATIVSVLNDSRLVTLEFDGTSDAIWEGLARHGRPVQYSHLSSPLAVWDTWTAIAGPPVAFEPPSAGFVLDWQMLAAMVGRGVAFATITHAAGLSSTGDPRLDARLPFDEPYRIPKSTAQAIVAAQNRGGRIVAVGTTVVRALEYAARCDGVVHDGEGLAIGRIDAASPLRVVDAIVSGTHERGASHYELLRAFADDETLERMDEELNRHGYRTHEFGDSVFVEKAEARTVIGAGLCRGGSRTAPTDRRTTDPDGCGSSTHCPRSACSCSRSA